MPPVTTRDRVASLSLDAFAEFAALRDAIDPLRWRQDVRAAVVLIASSRAPAADAGELRWLERFPLPTIAALSGEIGGPAVPLALACDIRVADSSLRLSLPPSPSPRMAVLTGAPGAEVIARCQGMLDAEAAMDAGLVSAIVPADAAAEAERLAHVIASRGPIATRLASEAIWRGLPQDFEQALRFETDLTLLLQTTKDRAEGVRAFLEKRAPDFTGK